MYDLILMKNTIQIMTSIIPLKLQTNILKKNVYV